MKVSFFITLLISVFLSTFSWPALAGGWTGASKVTMIYPFGSTTEGGDQAILTRLENSPSNAADLGFNPDNCSGTFYYQLSSKNNSFDAIYSLLLSMQVSQTPINLYLNGCAAGGTNGWPLILHAQLITP